MRFRYHTRVSGSVRFGCANDYSVVHTMGCGSCSGVYGGGSLTYWRIPSHSLEIDALASVFTACVL